MAAIHDEEGVSRHQLEPSRPGDGGDAFPHGLVGDGKTPLPKRFDDGEHHSSVIELVLAQQRQVDPQVGTPVEDLSLQGSADQVDAVKVRGHPLGAYLFTAGVNDRLHRGLLPVGDGDGAGLDDLGLGLTDLLQGVAQKFRVIQSDVGEHGHQRRLDDVGGIQLAAHAHLQAHHVAVVALEILHGNAGDQFKFRGVILHGLGQGLDKFRNFRQLLVGNALSVHLHALVEAEDIRRGIKTGAVTSLSKNAGRHGGGGAFAVGAGNVDKLQLILGISHLLEELLGTPQAGDASLPADGVDVGKGFFGCHGDSFFP